MLAQLRRLQVGIVLVILDIDGDLEQGAAVALEIRQSSDVAQTRTRGKLPPAPTLLAQYQRWQSLYRSLAFLFRIEDRPGQIPNVSSAEVLVACHQAAQDLSEMLNGWLGSESFRPIREKLLEKLQPTDAVQLILQVEAIQLRRLPWHLWDFFERYPKAEVALSAAAYEQVEREPPPRDRARILAILGNRQGINVEADRQLLENLPDGAETIFLVEPSRQQLYQWLWDAAGWDILFFAGHSRSQTDGKAGEIELNPGDCLTLDELTYALRKAIERGLKLAIFNSCDGLGLARQLESLYIPQIAVMREPVPDRVAQEFLKHFLTAFSSGKSLYLAVREAREQLQALEDRFPCASWLPAICQNPAEVPLSWQALVSRSRAESRGPKAESESDLAIVVDIPVSPCPYRGLSAFQETDAPFFFGRDGFAERLFEAVNQKPLVAAVGPSGSGKSSVVFAGLIPRLRHEGDWLVVSFRPGNRPFFRLAEQLIPLLESGMSETEQLVEANKLTVALQQQTLAIADVIERILNKTPHANRLLLVADQFEELYILDREQGTGNREQGINNPPSSVLPLPSSHLPLPSSHPPLPSSLFRLPSSIGRCFQDQLLAAIAQASNLKLVLTLRADFVDRALFYRPFAEALRQHGLELLGPMTRAELQAAVQEPAQQLGVTIEQGLTARILDAVSEEPGYLPLLEFALTLLWEKQQNRMLTHAAYEAIGGIEQALAGYAEQIYDSLSLADRQRAQHVFVQLIHPGEGTADTRRVATRTEVGTENWDLVAHLANARLVVSQQDEGTGEETVEIVHEALIWGWQRLGQWLEDDRSFRTWQERLRIAIQQWQASRQDEGALLRGGPLLNAQQWLQERQADLSQLEQEFIQTSVVRQLQEQRLRDRVRHRITSGLAGGLAAALFLVGIAGWQWRRAEIGETNAQLSALSASAKELFASKKELEALLESLKAAQTLQQSAGIKADTRIQVLAALQQAVYEIREYNRLEGHDRTVIDVTFSPDGRTIASASDDGTVKLWQQDGTLLKTLRGHEEPVRSVRFSPDGQVLASASYDGTIKLWQKNGTLLRTLNGHQDKVNSVHFSPDGKLLVSASADKTIKLWTPEGKLVRTLTGHRAWVRYASFSRDGQILASASADKTVRLWQPDGTPIATLKGHEGTVNSVSFSPDGALLASASNDKTIKLWHRQGTLVKTLTGHTDRIWDIQFSPDGQTLASTSADQTAKLWQLDGRLRSTLAGHNAPIYSISFSPNGQTLATASSDTTIKLWQRESRPQLALEGHRDRILNVRFSPDGQTLATASTSGTTKLWQRDGSVFRTLSHLQTNLLDLDFSNDSKLLVSASAKGTLSLHTLEGKELKSFSTHQQGVLGIALSPDDKTLATAGKDGTLKLWRQDGTWLRTLWGHRSSVMDVQFSPNGNMLVTAGDDNTIKLWTQQGKLLKTLTEHNSRVWEVDFSPDGRLLASASRDGTVRLWHRSGKLLNTLKGHNNQVVSVNFSPDGRVLASASLDGTVRLWSLEGTLLATLWGHRGSVMSVRFSPDGTAIASAGDDRAAILWNLDLDNLMAKGCDWIRDYLKTNPNLSDTDRDLCNGIGRRKARIHPIEGN